jgi:hypothetical protein
VKDISVYLRGENERLTAALRLECEGKELVHREWLELNDGTISDKTIKRLRQCFPKWDGSIETLEQGFCVKDVEVEVTVENEQDKQDPEKWWTRTKFMDPPGGGSSGSASMPEKVSRGTLVSKYGARFRALAGGTPAGAAGARGQKPEVRSQNGEGKALAEAQGAQRAGPPEGRSQKPEVRSQKVEGMGVQGSAATSSLEACWEALCKKYPDEFREQVGERWFKLLEQVVPGKDQADFSPEDWGAVMVAIALPF